MTGVTLISPVDHDGEHFEAGQYLDINGHEADALVRVAAAVKGKKTFEQPLADTESADGALSEVTKVREEADVYAAEVRAKADAEAQALLQDAKKQADAIVSEAHKQADDLVAKAQPKPKTKDELLAEAKAEGLTLEGVTDRGTKAEVEAAVDAARAAKRD